MTRTVAQSMSELLGQSIIIDNRSGNSIEIPIVNGGVDAAQWSKLLPGVWFLDLTERKLKTKQSQRQVPLHKTLIDVGFVTYAQGQQNRPDKPGKPTKPGKP